MVAFSPELNAILDDFSEIGAISDKGGKSSAAYQHVVQYLEKSEVLLRTTEQAVAAKDLKQFSLMRESENGAASYASKSKTVNFKLTGIESAAREADMIFGFGHEVGHANNYHLFAPIRESFKAKAVELAQQAGIRDYTPLVQEALEDHARDEGLSQFAGWDALVSYLRKDNPDVTLQDIYATDGNFKQRFFNEDGQLKEGYHLNENLSFDPDSKNMAAVKAHFYEPIRNSTGVGDAGYRDQYSHRYIDEYINDAEGKYKVVGTPIIDMQSLGLSPQRIEEIQQEIKTLRTPEQVKEQGLEQGQSHERVLEQSRTQLMQDENSHHVLPESEPHISTSEEGPNVFQISEPTPNTAPEMNQLERDASFQNGDGLKRTRNEIEIQDRAGTYSEPVAYSDSIEASEPAYVLQADVSLQREIERTHAQDQMIEREAINPINEHPNIQPQLEIAESGDQLQHDSPVEQQILPSEQTHPLVQDQGRVRERSHNSEPQVQPYEDNNHEYQTGRIQENAYVPEPETNNADISVHNAASEQPIEAPIQAPIQDDSAFKSEAHYAQQQAFEAELDRRIQEENVLYASDRAEQERLASKRTQGVEMQAVESQVLEPQSIGSQATESQSAEPETAETPWRWESPELRRIMEAVDDPDPKAFSDALDALERSDFGKAFDAKANQVYQEYLQQEQQQQLAQQQVQQQLQAQQQLVAQKAMQNQTQSQGISRSIEFTGRS